MASADSWCSGPACTSRQLPEDTSLALHSGVAPPQCRSLRLGLCSPHAPCADLVGKAVTAFLACRAEAAEATKRGLPIASATTTALSAQISGRYCRWAVLQFGAEDRAVALMLRSRCNSCAPELPGRDT